MLPRDDSVPCRDDTGRPDATCRGGKQQIPKGEKSLRENERGHRKMLDCFQAQQHQPNWASFFEEVSL